MRNIFKKLNYIINTKYSKKSTAKKHYINKNNNALPISNFTDDSFDTKKIIEGKISELQENRKKGEYAVKFRGSMIAFVNALWTGFEIVDKEILGDDKFIVRVKMRGENRFDDLLKVLIGQINMEAAWEVLPSMQEIFIDLVKPKEQLQDAK